MNAKLCICKGQPIEMLLPAYAARTTTRIAEGVVEGQAPPAFVEMRRTLALVRALAEGREKAPFQANVAHLDHHLPECPCSPRYAGAR